MRKALLPSRRVSAVAICTIAVVCAAVFLFQPRGGVLGANAQLVSVQPLPDMDGAMCEYPPAGASQTLATAFRQNAPGATAGMQFLEAEAEAAELPQSAPGATADTGHPTEELPDMAPVRTIHDPYSGFSSISWTIKTTKWP